MRPRSPGGILALLLCSSAAVTTASAESVYTLNSALGEFHDLSLLQRPADPPRRYAQLSSWDRNLANYDQGNFLREEGNEMVLMDVQGPGVLTRLWTAEPMGYLQFYWDGSPTPQFACLWKDLQEGKVKPLEEPFVTSRGGGCVMRFPLPFEKGLKITLSGQTWCHWQVGYHYFTPGTRVQSWNPAMGPPPGGAAVYTACAEAWKKPAEVKVPGDATFEEDVALSSGTPAVLYAPSAPVMVTEVSFEQLNGRALPPALEFVLLESGAESIRIPWATLSGLWEAEGDSASLLQGRVGMTSYFRVPFALAPGERVGLDWASSTTDDEAVGKIRIRTLPLDDGGRPTPRLFARRSIQQVGLGARFHSDLIEGSGRLLAIGARSSAETNAGYMEGDELIFLEGELFASLRGTGFEDLFDSAWYFEKGKFATAVAASPYQENGLKESAARGSWWPLGVPFAKSIRMEIEGGALDDAPRTRQDVVLIGQLSDHPKDVPPPQRTKVDVVDVRQGLRLTAAENDGAGLPVYTEIGAPLTATLTPKEAWLHQDEELAGEFDVEIPGAGLRKLDVRLDLPFGWRGRLEGNGEQKEVFDIGWPPITLIEPTAGTHKFTWRAAAPDVLQGGDYIVQLRAEGERPDGSVYTVRHPVRLYATPRGPAEITFPADAFHREEDGTRTLALPADFQGRAGDRFVLDARLDVSDGWKEDFAELHFEPVASSNVVEGVFTEIKDLLPPDGETLGRVQLHGRDHAVFFPVGRYLSWVGKPRALRISLQDHATDSLVINGARLHRQLPLPKTEGWSRRIPYLESPPGRFSMPDAVVMLVGNELRERVRLVVSTPQDQINPELRRAAFLENVEAGRMEWKLAAEPRRKDLLNQSASLVFPARRTGERMAIHDERFVGKRYFGFQFGYDPWSGIVGVRDCEGRLVGVQNLYMNQPATFPQYLWVALPVPSRDGWIYLEALGQPAGSFEQRIALQRVMVFKEGDPEKALR